MSEHTTESAVLVERACEVMHDAYELAAVTQDWETQERSRKPWAEVPEANKETMRAAVRALFDWLSTPPGDEPTCPSNTACRGTCDRHSPLRPELRVSPPGASA